MNDEKKCSECVYNLRNKITTTQFDFCLRCAGSSVWLRTYGECGPSGNFFEETGKLKPYKFEE
jgi:hypothetical protein